MPRDIKASRETSVYPPRRKDAAKAVEARQKRLKLSE